MLRTRLVLAAAGSLLALTACSSENEPPERTWTLTYDAGKPVPLATRIGSPVLTDGSLVYAYTDQPSGGPNRIASTDLATGSRTELARAVFKGGSVTGIVRTENTIVYVEESARGSLDPGSAFWRVVALGPKGAVKELATNYDRRDNMSPELSTVGGAAVWVVFPNQGNDPQAFTWQPGQGAPAPADAMPGDANECTPPSASSAELVSGCIDRNGWIAWTERAGPPYEQEDTSDPTRLFFAGENGKSQLVADLEASTRAPEIFDDYLLWDRGDSLEVTSLEHPSATAEVARQGLWFVAATDGRAAAIFTQTETATSVRIIDRTRLRLTPAGGS